MKSFLDKASKAYYDGEPFLTDAEFDYLAEQTGYNKVGATPTNDKIKHPKQLYSLQKFYKDKDKLPSLGKTIVTPKLDGCAISLVFSRGRLLLAATRGDGIYGENVSHNIIGWNNIPQTIDKLELIQIVGEIVAPKEIKNARNYATGGVRLKDTEEFLSRDLHFVAYGYTKISNQDEGNYLDDLKYLESQGFRTVLEDGLEDVYPTDGIVFRVNSNKEYYSLGFTAKHPKGAFAVKDEDAFEVKEAVLLDVEWQVGQTGKVTPVAIIEPVEIEDALISRVTLNNAGFLEDLDLYYGDTLLVTRSGGIIPKIIGKK